ncbi:MAG: tRNA (adenosine(37)-N6)-threonylcarbamoyltransferase complex ATPase subunit type 1 TsaE [Verrucomicrobia bacterium]|nr:tRNA (adenosine(37)-N6)-threonylcarbamoyltransferase complex ATPase subunit type 1 TsaE [Verrucomicrobiota bacterium]
MGRKLVTTCAEETLALGRELALELSSLVCLFGDLGAGKTTLIKGIIESATGTNVEQITSPTFVYLQSYGKAHHFDLYRLRGAEQFLDLGFDEYLYGPQLTLIEWPERIETLLPREYTRITLTHAGGDKRYVELEKCRIS